MSPRGVDDELPETAPQPPAPADRRLPKEAFSIRASRWSGPGGQNVNRRATRIEIIVDLDRIGLEDEELTRVRQRLASRLDGVGRLLVVCSETRSQHRNRELGLERAAQLIDGARRTTRPRKATRVSKAQREARLRGKAQQARKKALRRDVGFD